MKLRKNKNGQWDKATKLAILAKLEKHVLNEEKKQIYSDVYLCNAYNKIVKDSFMSQDFPELYKVIKQHIFGTNFAIHGSDFQGHTHWSIRIKVLNDVKDLLK